jgi:hypothetical protein
MPAEIDTVIDDGAGIVTLIESKAAADYALRRDEALVFSGKVRDHQRSRSFRWSGVHALVASAGRLDAIFCRWCFYEGIDVVDPDRFPLIVLARLPYLLTGTEAAMLLDHYPYRWLQDILRLTPDETATGPMLLRRRARLERLREGALHDLNDIQAKLSESVWAVLASPSRDSVKKGGLFNRARRQFEELGVMAPIARATPAGPGQPCVEGV